MRRLITKISSITALLALLSGCILVDDFGKRWDEAKPDACMNDTVKSLYISEFRRDPEGKNLDNVAREITIDGQNYLLLKKNPEDKGGRIYRFTITAGKEVHAMHVAFQRWRLDPTMRDTFLHDYPNSVASINHDTVTLPNLDDDSEKLLTEIANKPEYWQIEEQSLYNILRNPKCRFDTRDFSEDSKPYKSPMLPKAGYRGAHEKQNYQGPQ